jgi:acetyl-CoA acetyltransferase
MALREVAVVGVAPTKQARRLTGVTEFDLVLGALDDALADAGLTRAEVDGVCLEWPGPGGIPGHGPFDAGDASSWARVLGHDLAWVSDGMLDTAGAKGVLKAATAVSAGLCEVAVVGGAQSGAFSGAVDVPVKLEFTDVWGAYVVPMFALVAARHMHEFGTTPEQLAAVAVAIRNLGYRNPEAVMYGKTPITVPDVLASRMIATPFHLLDLCVNAEGGGVVVLTSTERARDLRQPVVSILGGGMQFHGAPYTNPPLYREVGRIGAAAAQRAYRMAGVGPEDLDLMAVYDPNTFEVIRQLEVFGVCKEGEGGPYVESTGIGLDSPLPVNTDGGMLSYAWNGTQHMTLRVIEVVRQLRGTAIHQVAGAEVGLAANAGSAASHQELLILGKA